MIGYHISFSATNIKHNLLELKNNKGMPVQIFIGSNRNMYTINGLNNSFNLIDNAIKTYYPDLYKNHNVYIHNTYCSNIYKDLFDPSAYNLLFDWINNNNIKGFVVHIPSTNQNINTFINNINLLNKNAKILLELIDNKGPEHNNVQRVLNLLNTVRKHNKNIKICIDTAHLYMSGYNDIISYMEEVGYNNIGLIHYNGSSNYNKDASGNYIFPGTKHTNPFDDTNKINLTEVKKINIDKIIEDKNKYIL